MTALPPDAATLLSNVALAFCLSASKVRPKVSNALTGPILSQ